MKLQRLFRNSVLFVSMPSPIEEDEFRYKTFEQLVPVLFIIFTFIGYVVFPMKFGFGKELLDKSNFVKIQLMLALLLLMYAVNKRGKAKYIVIFLPLLLGLSAVTTLYNAQIMSDSSFTPFYGVTISILFAGTFLELRKATMFISTAVVTFLYCAIDVGMYVDELMHRSSIIFFVTFFIISLGVARKKVFLELAEKSTELLEMSNIQMLAELSGGVAHEINNPLSIISALALRVKKRIGKDQGSKEEYMEDLEKINNTVFRISKITSSLLEVAHKRDGKNFETVEISNVITDSVSIFEEIIKQKGIKLTIGKIPDGLSLECSSVQILQIFVNLISNSIDALEGEKSPWISIEIKEEKEKLSIFFCDSGPGIPSELVEKILLPFFTTKEIGKGAGLGLSICRRITTSHGGKFSIIESAPNTTFQITLPKKHA